MPCLHLRHVSQHAEDDEARHEAGDAVDCAEQEQERSNTRGHGDVSPCEDGVLVAVVVELVVAGEGEQGPEPGPQREEDLGGGGYPDLTSVSTHFQQLHTIYTIYKMFYLEPLKCSRT